MVEVEQTAFEIIASAGDAQSMMLSALQCAREGKFQEAENLMNEAKTSLAKAHNAQTGLIVEESKGNKSKYSIIMVHAQDHLMNAILSQTLIGEMLHLYRKLEEK
ncbi:cellobiose-specific phosphotransferase system component IIA [Bacillus niacini]|uniref:PTS system lactose-specific EIIA component n=1 Tax=Neobacillus niacini TaxID=86668 RepID=A0A852T688_9BACI|nr:PTS lactose/cellobiose transporter subunit IIA [Neobacillus niacini]NYE03376.1 cellobiose-specific phosphotransferase system component IIA [Neobacillus niacini]